MTPLEDGQPGLQGKTTRSPPAPHTEPSGPWLTSEAVPVSRNAGSTYSGMVPRIPPCERTHGLHPEPRGQHPAPAAPGCTAEQVGKAEAPQEPERLLTWMSLFRILPTAGKEPSTRCCWTIQPLAATSSFSSMKMKLRAWAKDFRT